MAYTLRFPITLEDIVTGATRLAKANEIKFGIDDEERMDDQFSLTEYPRDKDEENGTAIWFSNGSIFVAKMYPNWCPSFMPFCRPTNPILPKVSYQGNVKWRANEFYITGFSFLLAEGETTKVVPLTLLIPSDAPPPNGPPPNGDGNGWDFNRILEWIKAHPVESVAISAGTYLLVRGK